MLDPSLDAAPSRPPQGTHGSPCRTAHRVSNFSSIGVSAYEITRDGRVTWPVPARAPVTGAHWKHGRRSGSAAARDGRRAHRVRAPPARRTLAVAAHGPGLSGRRQFAARVRASERSPGARRPERGPPTQLAGKSALLRRGAHHAGPSRRGGADVYRLRASPRLAGRRPRATAKHPEDPPNPASRA